jgi:crotonobetainyl-CoA:carnitine CoA-transferase CaiB-like acyl-CoA transferase
MIRSVFDPTSGRNIYLPNSPLRMNLTPGRGPNRIPVVDADRSAVTRIADGSAAPVTTTVQSVERALQGVRIIEIGQYTTAPLSARHLAHLGADVIKVEQPQGDEARTWVPHVKGRSISFRLNNADKRSIALDLRSAPGTETLTRLIESADVLVENLKPGALAKLGFSLERIAQINPRLVYCTITGFGADSLYAGRPAFDTVIQAMSGFMAAVSPDGLPMKSGISSADTMGAEMAIVAILAALEHRDKTGHGQAIDLSMQDIAAWMTQTQWNLGADRNVARPAVLRSRDGYVLADTTPERVEEALQRLAIPGPSDVGTMERDAVVALLTRAGIRSAPVLTVDETAVLAQTKARRLWATVEEDGELWPILASPLRLLATPPRFSHLAPDLNQNREVIMRELGLQANLRP